MNLIPMVHHPTYEHYSPHDLLPAPLPATTRYPTRYFYENVAKHLIKDFIRIMNNGLHIDLTKVEELELVLDNQLADVAVRLAKNPLIAKFQLLQHHRLVAIYVEEQRSKIKPIEHFLKPFNYKDKVHRSYFMTTYAPTQGMTAPTTLIEGTTIPEWSAKLVKKLSANRPLLQRLLNGELTEANPIVSTAMTNLAKDKAEKHNRRYYANIENPDLEVPPFNPGSSKQKQELFEWLGIPSEATSKDTGLPSWDRDQVERVNKTTSDEYVKDFTQAMIDQSFAAIVRNNFIEAFYNYTINNRLHGTYRLSGAKSFRPTSSNPWPIIAY